VGKEDDGLFYLLQHLQISPSPPISSFVCSSSMKTSMSDVWHYRLGHPSVSRIQFLHNNVSAIPCTSKDTCSICHLARQHRLPFLVHNSTTCMPFQLVYCDIWGSMATCSINGSHFFSLLLMITLVLLGCI
jgi:hypothetical protein